MDSRDSEAYGRSWTLYDEERLYTYSHSIRVGTGSEVYDICTI